MSFRYVMRHPGNADDPPIFVAQGGFEYLEMIFASSRNHDVFTAYRSAELCDLVILGGGFRNHLEGMYRPDGLAQNGFATVIGKFDVGPIDGGESARQILGPDAVREGIQDLAILVESARGCQFCQFLLVDVDDDACEQ